MAATSGIAPPQPPPTATPATISITDHTPNPDNNLYDITFQTNTLITTTVTADPSVVSAWIAALLSSPSPPTLFGIDVEWRPNRSRNSDNPVATLQLCTRSQSSSSTIQTQTHSCLIFQIIHCPGPLPKQLIELLGNKRLTFVGAGIEADVERLMVDYELEVGKKVDLGELAKDRNVAGLRPNSTTGLKELARVVLGVEVNKPKSVTMSRWDQGWLSYQQIQYACVDAFLSFEIGSSLLGSQ